MISLQEKRGLLFCKEDWAILCRDCDVSVHTASELTMRHTRFLLTGVRLSAEPAACPSPPSDDENSSDSLCCSAGNENLCYTDTGTGIGYDTYRIRTFPKNTNTGIRLG